jgi:hypothetical protein
MSLLQNPVWMPGFREAGRCNVNVNGKVVVAVFVPKDRPFEMG